MQLHNKNLYPVLKEAEIFDAEIIEVEIFEAEVIEVELTEALTTSVELIEFINCQPILKNK